MSSSPQRWTTGPSTARCPADLPDITRSGAVTTQPDRQRDALRAALDSLRRYDTHSESGDAVRDRLFGPEGEMAKLAAVLDARDTAGLRAWDETYTEVTTPAG